MTEDEAIAALEQRLKDSVQGYIRDEAGGWDFSDRVAALFYPKRYRDRCRFASWIAQRCELWLEREGQEDINTRRFVLFVILCWHWWEDPASTDADFDEWARLETQQLRRLEDMFKRS